MALLTSLIDGRYARPLLMASVLAGCFSGPWSQATAKPSDSKAVEQEVIAVDDAYVQAEARHDESTMRRMVDDRFVFNSYTGANSGKEDFLNYVLKLPIASEAIRERSVLIEGDVALVFATTDITFAPPGKPQSIASMRYTCTYVRRGKEWRMLALQIQDHGAE